MPLGTDGDAEVLLEEIEKLKEVSLRGTKQSQLKKRTVKKKESKKIIKGRNKLKKDFKQK